jgi:hypothetical protein
MGKGGRPSFAPKQSRLAFAGHRQASEGCRHQVEFRLELRNPSELHAQLSFRGGETLFDSLDRCRRRPDDADARRGWCGRQH